MHLVRRILIGIFVCLGAVNTSFARASSTSIGQKFDSSQQQKVFSSDREKVNEMAEIAWNQRTDSSERAIGMLTNTIHLADSLSLNSAIAACQIKCGIVNAYYLANYPQAIFLFKSAIENAKKQNDFFEIAHAYYEMGNIGQLTNDLLSFNSFQDSALIYFNKSHLPESDVYSLLVREKLAKSKRNYTKALSYLNQAGILLKDSSENKILYASVHNEEASIVFKQRKNEKGLRLFQRNLNFSSQNHMPFFQVQALCGMGIILFQQKKYKRALSFFSKSEQLLNSIPQSLNLVDIYLYKAKIYRSFEKEDSVNYYFREAESIVRSQNAVPLLLKVKSIELNDGVLNKSTKKSREVEDKLYAYEQLVDSIYSDEQKKVFLNDSKFRQMESKMQLLLADYSSKRWSVLVISIICFITVLLLMVIAYKSGKYIRHNVKLQKANESKDHLVSILSHDLRTPLSGIIQYLNLLKEVDLEEKDNQLFLDSLSQQTESTVHLLDELLLFMRLNGNKLKTYPENNRLEESFGHLKNSFIAQIEMKRLEFISDFSEELVYADKRMLEIIFRNIFSNAIKFSYPEGRIIMKSFMQGKYKGVSITNFGESLTKEQIEKILKADSISSGSGTLGEKGHGFGLKICRQLVELHGGKLIIESTSQMGTSFTCLFPERK